MAEQEPADNRFSAQGFPRKVFCPDGKRYFFCEFPDACYAGLDRLLDDISGSDKDDLNKK